MAEVSIIIRAFNEERYIGDLLRAVKNQNYRDFEIIVVDSGSTDRTPEIAREFTDKVVQIPSRDFTFGYSLNTGVKNSQGKYLVLISAHALPTDKFWLENLITPFSNKNVAMVYGRQVGGPESKFSEKMDFKRLFKDSPVDSKIFLDYANNANAALRRDLWQEHNFDEYLFGLEDIEWARHFTQKGFLVHYAPEAVIFHLHRERWPQIFNRYRREAIAAVRLGLLHPPQARTGFIWFLNRILGDLLSSFPNSSLKRIKEIIRFRYLQWKGTRYGWVSGKDINFNREKHDLFYPTTNEAVIIKGKNRAQIEEVPLPELKPGDVLIKVAYVGVCRTDLEVFDGSLGYYRSGLAHYPIVPGHEFSGTIVRIGANNLFQERFKVGDKVVGECILSRDEKVGRQEAGVINYNGAYSQYIVMSGQHLHQIPEGLDLIKASLAEPLAVVLRALRRAEPRLDFKKEVAVIGAGSIGNLIAQVLTLRGFSVTVFDRNEKRLDFLKNKVKSVSVKLESLDKFGTIIEATGSADILKEALRGSGLDATLLLLGFPYGNFEYNFEDVVGKDKVILGSVGGDARDFDEALDLLPKLDTAPFTQHILSIEEFARAWEMHNSSKQLKIILKL